MSSFLFAEQQEEPFQAQQSPPSSPLKTTNPYDKSLARYRSNSSSAGSKIIPHSPSATSTGLARQPSFGSAGQAVGSSPSSQNASATGLDRKRTNSFGAKNGVAAISHPAVPPPANPDVSGNSQFETFDIPERDEDSPTPVPPPAWERRKSMIVRAEEREREQQIQRELQAYQAQQDAEKKAQEAAQATKSGHGLFRRSKSKSGLDQVIAGSESRRSSKELSPNLKIPVTSSRRRPQSMLQMTSSSSNSNISGSHSSTLSDQSSANPRSSDTAIMSNTARSSEDLDSPLPMPNAAFLNGGYSSPGHSRRSSSSSLRGSSSRRSSAYGSPLGLTGDGLNMSLPPITAIPDMSNPMRSATERPLDTIRQMSMRSERNLDGAYNGSATPREYNSISGGGRRRSKIPGAPPVGVILDESIWPSAPTMMEINDIGRPMKSRSTVSLVSLGRNSKTISRSTPASPQMAKGKQPLDSLSPVSTRSTIGRNSMYGPPMAVSRDYMLPLSHREGGYAIAATLHGANGPTAMRGSGEYGRSSEHNRYSVDGGMDDYGMYARGMNASRPSLPGQSTSTSTTSLYHPEYAAPPSAYPHHMPTDPSVAPVPAAGLTKTPSPLSHLTEPDGEDEKSTSNASDVGLQMRSRSAQAPSAAEPPSRNTPQYQTTLSDPVQSSLPADPGVSAPTEEGSRVDTAVQLPKKSKKQLAKEAKDAKEKRKAEEKSKATEAARQKAEAAREKKKREEDEKVRKEAEKKAAKLKAKQDKAQAKTQKAVDVAKPKTSTLVMPATPLKGRTTDLSAATPTSLPGTPATPAEPMHLIDMPPSEAQSANAPKKPSPLSEEPRVASVQQPDSLPVATPGAAVIRTPLKGAPGTPQQTTPKQSQAQQSVKPKLSLFGTLRRKFGSPSSPASSVRAGTRPRDLVSTPESGPSASASVRSTAQPNQSSPQLSGTTIPDGSDSSRMENSNDATSEPIKATPVQATTQASSTSVAIESPPTSSIANLAENPDADFQDRNMLTTQMVSLELSKKPEADNSAERPAGNQEAKQVMEQMIARAREGGLDVDLHVKYIQDLDTKTDELAYHMTEHLRINGVYWGLVALCLMNRPEALDREEMIKYVLSCWDNEAGAFGAHPRHDGHILATLSAVQILAIQDALDLLDRDRIVKFIVSLIDPVTGAVAGDRWGEQDTRFSYIAISILSLIGRLDVLDVAMDGKAKDLIVGHIARCRNFDGGFGAAEGSESHGGQIFVCVAALAILDRLDLVDTATLAWWISERQLPNGGLNGRPEKLEDVCYSWWNLSALSILGKLHWINREELIKFILNSQDPDKGGIADRPGDWVDVFHTNFGLAGLSLLGYAGLQDIDPVYCMPVDVIERLGLKKRYQLLPKDGTHGQKVTASEGAGVANGNFKPSGKGLNSTPQLAPPLPMTSDLALEQPNEVFVEGNASMLAHPLTAHSPSRRLSRASSKSPEGPRPRPTSIRQ